MLRSVPVLMSTGALFAAVMSAPPASAAGCPGFSAKGSAVSGVRVSGVSCATGRKDLTKALGARKGRSSWSCAGFSWTAKGAHVTGRAGSKRITATVA